MLQPHAPRPSSFSVLIVGSGLAGATLAHALALRGCHITVLERSQVADGASGNPAGVLFPQFGKISSVITDWHLTSYRYMLDSLALWKNMGYQFTYKQCGMVRLPRVMEEIPHLQAIHQQLGVETSLAFWADKTVLSGHSKMPISQDGLYFPQGTWVAAGELCRALLGHPCIEVIAPCNAQSISRGGNVWHVDTEDGRRFNADHCIIASAHEANQLLPGISLRLHGVGGQVSYFAAADVAAPLRTILCYRGYIIPMEDRYLVGATYNHAANAGAVTQENHARNIADVEAILPGWIQGAPIDGRTRFRATSPDRLPYAGMVEDGLWVSVGHGSRGLLSAPLSAEIIAAKICGEPIPFNPGFQQALNPHRFR